MHRPAFSVAARHAVATLRLQADKKGNVTKSYQSARVWLQQHQLIKWRPDEGAVNQKDGRWGCCSVMGYGILQV